MIEVGGTAEIVGLVVVVLSLFSYALAFSEPREFRKIEAIPFRHLAAVFFVGKPNHALPRAVLGADVNGRERHGDVDTWIEPLGISFVGGIQDHVGGGFVIELLSKSFLNVFHRAPLRLVDGKMLGEGTRHIPIQDLVAPHISQGGEGVGHVILRRPGAYMGAQHGALSPAGDGKALGYAGVDAGIGGLAHVVFGEALVCFGVESYDPHRRSFACIWLQE